MGAERRHSRLSSTAQHLQCSNSKSGMCTSDRSRNGLAAAAHAAACLERPSSHWLTPHQANLGRSTSSSMPRSRAAAATSECSSAISSSRRSCWCARQHDGTASMGMRTCDACMPTTEGCSWRLCRRPERHAAAPAALPGACGTHSPVRQCALSYCSAAPIAG